VSDPASVELAIIGGGCAGLSLARELAQRIAPSGDRDNPDSQRVSVVVLEPRTEYIDDRSWCFWATEDHPLSHVVSHRWQRWRYGVAGEPPSVVHSDVYSYQHLRSINFYRGALEQIGRCEQIELRLGVEVLALDPDPAGWRIRTDHGDLIAAKVVDTRPPAAPQRDASVMFQCFLGVELRFSQPVGLDPGHIDLMTDMATEPKGFRFSYVLSFAPDHLLAEVTYFSPQPLCETELTADLERLLRERGWSDGTVVRSECAVLPMGLPELDLGATATMVRAGMGGGALRPASGFGFRRIQRWAQLCADTYTTSAILSPQPAAHWRQRWMDHLLLCVLRDRPELAPRVFEQLLRRCPADRFVRFMDDSASLADTIFVIAAMPKLPFIAAAVRYRRRR
jgi:lycopene beta-cyclase